MLNSNLKSLSHIGINAITKTSFQFLDRLDSSQDGKKQEMYSPELETFRIKPSLEEKTEENGKQIVQPEAVSAAPTKA